MSLAEIRARLNAATEGPWSYRVDGDAVYIDSRPGFGITCGTYRSEQSEADAALIAHAPSDLGFLLARVEQLTQAGADLLHWIDPSPTAYANWRAVAAWRSAVAALDQEEER